MDVSLSWDRELEAAGAWYLHRSLLAQDETLLSTTGAGAMEQRGSRGATTTVNHVHERVSLGLCGAESRSYTAEYTLIASRDAFMAAKTLQRAGAVARAAYVLLRTQRTKQDEQTTTTTDCNNDLPSSGKHDTMSCGMGAR